MAGNRTLPLITLLGVLAACSGFGPATIGPFLLDVNGAAAPAGPVGSTVVFQGSYFGSTQGAGQVLFTNALGFATLAAPIANASDWGASAIVTTVPAGAITGSVAVQANGLVSSALIFTVAPTVTSPTSFTPSALTWAPGAPLPSAVSGAGVAFAQTTGYVYTVGGAGSGGAPVASVNFAKVGMTGTIGTWAPTTSLTTAVAFPAAVIATHTNSAVLSTTGYLYVLGGATNSSGTSTALVSHATIHTDGTVGPWTPVTPLPVALHALSATIQYGSLYVVGGADGANAPQTKVYRAPIQQDGSLVSWLSQSFALPAPLARLGFGASGLYLYAFGGDGSAVTPNDSVPSGAQVATVYYAKLNPSTRDIATAWTATTALPNARSAHTAVFGAGNVLLIGGLYLGASTHTSEATYAALNVDGTVGSFTPATPAMSIYSLCGCNLFNSGATAYLGGDGSFHVLIVGGDDVSAVGTRRLETFIY
jgi:hypothetical protein